MVDSKLEKEIETSLSRILAKKGIQIRSLTVEQINKIMDVRTNAYKLLVDTGKGILPIFCKEYIDYMGGPRDLAGKPRGTTAESEFLRFFEKYNGFTPLNYGKGYSIDEERGRDCVREFVFMEYFDMTMEDQISMICSEKESQEKNAVKKDIEDIVGDYIRRAIDIYYVNVDILNRRFDEWSPNTKGVFENLSKKYFEYRLNKYLNSILEFLIPDGIERTSWHTTYAMKDTFHYMIDILSAAGDGKYLHYEPRLAHILLKNPSEDDEVKATVAMVAPDERLKVICRRGFEKDKDFELRSFKDVGELRQAKERGTSIDFVLTHLNTPGREELQQDIPLLVIADTFNEGNKAVDSGAVAFAVIKSVHSQDINNIVRDKISQVVPLKALLKGKPSYHPQSIFSILDGRTNVKGPYHGIALGDLNKMGYGSIQLGLAALLNDPILLRTVSRKKLDQLFEHAVVAYNRVRQRKEVSLGCIDHEDKNRFTEVYHVATRYNLLRGLHFVFSLYKKDKEKFKSFESMNPLYTLAEHPKAALERILYLDDPTGMFNEFREGIALLKKFYDNKMKKFAENKTVSKTDSV